ncbi:hypothetical protein ARMGADRAFT_1045257 [Armillaria gallica]|uniref:Uncharacterized protein n=1 Tax=Armillaria gallica TaxID=47427 RepID=A0A2H3E472_ARMGA|nr:hypothetical protein ARMGADRAFT_1045257 [Armillaria gallica]
MLLHTSLKVKWKNFPEVMDRFGSVSAEAVAMVAQRVADGDLATANTPEEKRILALMKEVNAMSSAIPGSSMARVGKRNEVKAFIKTILVYDPKQENLEGGALGVVNAYYGCMEGSLNPDEIKNRIMLDNDIEFQNRLLAFLDDSITNEVPPEPHPDFCVPSDGIHVCTLRGIPADVPEECRLSAVQKDLHNLIEDCQKHSHLKTCFKYCKKYECICRFDLDESNYCEHSSFDYEKGELCLQCLDGLVNNFNETMIRAMRCNMDIKFIGSGASAKAILYYITDYITKSHLKVHVAYTALELSVKKLSEFDPEEDEITELSSQQVASYLMDYEDHFTSHEFQRLYWTSYKSFFNEEQPSPECQVAPMKNKEDEPEEVDDVFINPECEDNSDNEEDLLELRKADADVTISMDEKGKLVARLSVVCDYQLCGDFLHDLNLWEYTA